MLLTFIMLFGLALADGNDCQHTSSSFKCVEYVKNYDADTITFNIPQVHPLFGKKNNIRVSGVDTPEIRTKNSCEKQKARNAKNLVKSLLKKAKRIDLINLERGKYFRVVADVIVDGKSLSAYLLKNGHAYAYSGGKKKQMDWCKSHREIANTKN